MKAGDIILVHSGTSLVSRAISKNMREYMQHQGITLPKAYHHAGNIINVWGKLYVAEAGPKGYQCIPVEEAYTPYDWTNRIDVKTPVNPYTEAEKKLLSKEAIHFSLDITRYDYGNFWQQWVYIRTGLWLGKTGKKAERRLYCSEAVATLANKVRPFTFANPAAANPVDVAINSAYKYLEE